MKKIALIGLGGGGSKAVDSFENSENYDKIAVNSDVELLNSIKSSIKIQTGKKSNNGLGCGGSPKTGTKAFKEDKDAILSLIKQYDKVFIIATLGGGFGTGSVIELAKYLEKDYLIVVTKPFKFEGEKRSKNAQNAIDELNELNANTLIIDNESFVEDIIAYSFQETSRRR